jgi:putative endonuclease
VRHGYQVLARNWVCAHGEADLVLGRPGEVVICEVKARASADFGGPVGAVDWKKQRRLRRIAAAWLSEHRDGHVIVRFDVVSVVGAKVEVYESAF